MSLVILEEGSVPLSEELVREFGLHKGCEVEWERTEDGGLKLRPSVAPAGAGSQLLGILKPFVHEQEGGYEAYLKWRSELASLNGIQ